MENPKKAFGYLRVSSKTQTDGDGFPRQRAAIEKLRKMAYRERSQTAQPCSG
jgi:DNA invertase Pin-like site-specific DNA recombinase